MITTLALLAITSSNPTPLNTMEIISESAFDKTQIISVISEQVREQVENISSEVLVELNHTSLIVKGDKRAEADNNTAEALGDE